MLDLVTDPEAYMERKTTGPSLRRAFLVLLFVGALGVPGVVYAGQVIASNLSGGTGGTGSLMTVGLVVEPLVGIYIIWFGSVITAHVIANRFFNSREPLLHLLRTSAWAFIPIGVGNLARSGALYLVFRNPDLPSDPEGTRTLEIVQSLIAATSDNPISLVGFGILILSVLYSGYLFSFAIQNTKEISHDDALKAAAVPIGVVVIYFIQNMI